MYISLFLLVVFTLPAKAQEVVAPAGDHFEGTTHSISWTLGELAIKTLSANNYIITQGMQQPSALVVSVDELLDDKLEMVVYPNPTKDLLTIRVFGFIPQDLSYALYDMSGTRLQHARLEDPVVTFKMASYAPGNYFLRVYSGKSLARTFSIVKQ